MATRAADVGDVAAVAALSQSLGQPVSEADVHRDLERFGEGFFVVEAEGAIVGFLVLRNAAAPHCVPGVFPLQLWRLYVAVAFQGKGIARTLMGKAFIHAHRQRHDALWLGTEPNNARAIAFYEKCGLYAVGHAMLHEDADVPDLIMACTLG